jgi:hypothetical protein
VPVLRGAAITQLGAFIFLILIFFYYKLILYSENNNRTNKYKKNGAETIGMSTRQVIFHRHVEIRPWTIKGMANSSPHLAGSQSF